VSPRFTSFGATAQAESAAKLANGLDQLDEALCQLLHQFIYIFQLDRTEAVIFVLTFGLGLALMN
jgi:hypothetical protein